MTFFSLCVLGDIEMNKPGVLKYIVIFLGMFIVALAVLPLLALNGCPLPANVPAYDGAMGTIDAVGSAQEICAKLLDAGCVEGQATNCQTTFQTAIEQNAIRNFSVTCILDAGDKDAERTCPGIRCP
jgi:hypothetical protein